MYKKKSKLVQALKCLQFALKADKDLLRVFENISEIRARRRFDSLGNAQDLEELKLNDSYRNDMASTYLNMCAVLSLMKNHEKALNMAQKAIELVTNQRNVYLFNLESSIEQLEDKLKITLAGGYYNKAVELEHLNQKNQLKKEYALMALTSIKNAIKVCQYIPGGKEMQIFDDIMKFHNKISLGNMVRVSSRGSRGSSRRTQKRVFSPPSFTISKEGSQKAIQNFFDSSPKSSDGTIKPMYPSKTQEEKPFPFFYSRKPSNIEKPKENRADMTLFPVPNKIIESSSVVDRSYQSQNHQAQVNFSSHAKKRAQITKYNIASTSLAPLKSSAKTSFEVQPIPAFKKRSIQHQRSDKSIGSLSSNNGGPRPKPDRCYIDESDFIQQKLMEIDNVDRMHRVRKRKNKSTRTSKMKL